MYLKFNYISIRPEIYFTIITLEDFSIIKHVKYQPMLSLGCNTWGLFSTVFYFIVLIAFISMYTHRVNHI